MYIYTHTCVCVCTHMYLSFFLFSSYLSIYLVCTCNSLGGTLIILELNSPSNAPCLKPPQALLCLFIWARGRFRSHSAQPGVPCLFPEISLNRAVQKRAWELAEVGIHSPHSSWHEGAGEAQASAGQL